MNERIERILAQPVLERLSEWSNIGPVQRATVEEFTRLIIENCIGQVALIGIINSENDEHGDIGWTVNAAIDMIKDHFGVE
jgi:hypothetical protein